jgi:hypothetical protein
MRLIPLFFLVILTFSPISLNAADVLPTANDNPTPKFVLHNMYGSVFLNKLHDDGKEMHVQFGFKFQKHRGYGSSARSNIITLKPGEMRSFVISDLQLWVFNHEETEGDPVPPSEINPHELYIQASWPFVGSSFMNEPKQPYSLPEQTSYSWRRPPEKKEVIVFDRTQSAGDWLDLRKGTHIIIYRSNMYIDNGIDPIAQFRQGKKEPSE